MLSRPGLFYIVFQFFGIRLVEAEELHPDIKQVLCQSLAVYNPRACLECRATLVFSRQPEVNFDFCIKDHADGCLVLWKHPLDCLLVTAEFRAAIGQIKYQGSGHVAAGRPDFTRKLRFGTETLPVTAQVLSFIGNYRCHNLLL